MNDPRVIVIVNRELGVVPQQVVSISSAKM